MSEAGDQFKNEARAVLYRWELESDMSDDVLAVLAMEAVDEFLESRGKTVEFEADEEFEDTINEDEGEQPEEAGDDI